MKSFCLFSIVGLVAAVSFGSQSYGQTFLLQPGLQKTWRSMPRAFRNELSGATTAKLVRSFEIPQARLVRNIPFPRIPRTQIASALGGRIFRNDLSGATTEKIIRSLAPRQGRTQNVQTQQFNEQRVLRSPVSETVTQLPDEVTRITRNIDTHMPMVHKRIRNHYSVENINKKNVVHHYIPPVRDERLGTRKGRANKQQTEHVVHNKAYDNLPIQGQAVQTADLLL